MWSKKCLRHREHAFLSSFPLMRKASNPSALLPSRCPLHWSLGKLHSPCILSASLYDWIITHCLLRLLLTLCHVPPLRPTDHRADVRKTDIRRTKIQIPPLAGAQQARSGLIGQRPFVGHPNYDWGADNARRRQVATSRVSQRATIFHKQCQTSTYSGIKQQRASALYHTIHRHASNTPR